MADDNAWCSVAQGHRADIFKQNQVVLWHWFEDNLAVSEALHSSLCAHMSSTKNHF